MKLLKKILGTRKDTETKVLESEDVKSFLAYISILDNEKEKKTGLQRAREFHINLGNWDAVKKIAEEQSVPVSDSEKKQILNVRIEQGEKYWDSFIKRSQSLSVKSDQDHFLEHALISNLNKGHTVYVDLVLSLLNRELTLAEQEEYLLGCIDAGEFIIARDLAKKMDMKLTQDQIAKIFDNHSSYSSNSITDSELVMIELLNEPVRSEKIQQLILNKRFETSVDLAKMLHEPTRTLALEALIDREDVQGRMLLSSKIQLIELMSGTGQQKNVYTILDSYMDFNCNVVLDVNDIKILLSFLPKKSHKKIISKFLKDYISKGLYYVSSQYVELLGRSLTTKELDIILNSCLKRRELGVVKGILKIYPDAKRESKIKHVFQKFVEMDLISDATYIVDSFT